MAGQCVVIQIPFRVYVVVVVAVVVRCWQAVGCCGGGVGFLQVRVECAQVLEGAGDQLDFVLAGGEALGGEVALEVCFRAVVEVVKGDLTEDGLVSKGAHSNV